MAFTGLEFQAGGVAWLRFLRHLYCDRRTCQSRTTWARANLRRNLRVFQFQAGGVAWLPDAPLVQHEDLRRQKHLAQLPRSESWMELAGLEFQAGRVLGFLMHLHCNTGPAMPEAPGPASKKRILDGTYGFRISGWGGAWLPDAPLVRHEDLRSQKHLAQLPRSESWMELTGLEFQAGGLACLPIPEAPLLGHDDLRQQNHVGQKRLDKRLRSSES